MNNRDPWRVKLDRLNKRRKQKADGFGRNVEQIRAARQALDDETPRLQVSPWLQSPTPPRRRVPAFVFVTLGLLAAFAAPIAVHHSGIVDLRQPAAAVARSSAHIINVGEALSAKQAPRPRPRSIPICSGRNRVTCIVDGDTGWHEGQKWRLISRNGGVDAPEISKPECAAEGTAGDRATRRLQALVSGGYTLNGGDYDRYDRRLVTITLADGRDAGDVLLGEGLAQPWPNSGNPWCG